ncbi:MAG: class I SAM-dependent methyltransferase [Aquabacterium sp.]|nr:class I SAM-dependent methyltransferase [Aquabacterium sp.]
MNKGASVESTGFGQGYADEQIRRSRHPLRRFIKGFYLRSVLAAVHGPTIDYGCGAGQLLAQLPTGSVGLEVNPYLIAALTAAGLPVRQWQANAQGFDLADLDRGGYRCLVISHVLEHLDDPTEALTRLLQACRRVGVTRLIAIVPGAKGYASDATHRTFIDTTHIARQGWKHLAGYALTTQRHFPLPWQGGGALFIYNELQLVFDLVAPPIGHA